jgi:hypothetical protein
MTTWATARAGAREVLTWARGSRAVRVAVVLGGLYLVLGAAFLLAGASRGLISPSGTPHLEVVVLGGAYLLARVAVRFAAPALVAYAIAAALLVRMGRKP